LLFQQRPRPKIVVPAAAIPTFFAYFYDSLLGGHLWVFKIIKKSVPVNFERNGQRYSFASARLPYVCPEQPAQNSVLGLLASGVAQRPMQKISMEYIGKFPRNKAGNTAILLCVDAFSKFVRMIPFRQATTRATTKTFKEGLFFKFSVP